MKNHYQTLGVEWNVGLERIKQAYQELKNQYQKQPESDFTKERLKAIEEAYSILRNSIKREKYDVDYFMYFVKGEGNEPIESTNLVTMVSGNRKGIVDLRTNKVEFEETEREEQEELANPFKLVLPILVVGISLGLVYLNIQNWQVQASKTQLVQTPLKKLKATTTQTPQKLAKQSTEITPIELEEPLFAMHMLEYNEVNDYTLPKNHYTPPKKKTTKPTTTPSPEKTANKTTITLEEAPTPPTKKYRPHSGFSPYASHFGEHTNNQSDKNKLHITNQDQNDMVICLVQKRTNQVIQHVYVRSNAKYTFDQIPNGDYYLKAYYGKEWSDGKAIQGEIQGGFEQNEIYEIYDSNHEVFEMTQHTENAQVHYTQYQVQLGGKNNKDNSAKTQAKIFFKK